MELKIWFRAALVNLPSVQKLVQKHYLKPYGKVARHFSDEANGIRVRGGSGWFVLREIQAGL